MGPMSTAERQRRYRERALKDQEGTLLTRLQVMLSPSAVGDLERIAARTGGGGQVWIWVALATAAIW